MLASLLSPDRALPPLDLHERLLTEAAVRAADPDLAARCLIEAGQAALEAGELVAALAAAERAVALAERSAPAILRSRARF